ncbi:MAG: hypothetical protein ACD_50C00392G0001 [uncultured bacterium]|nr:MAG: hypothetical protein ACD_50C00392G0001 [uncultured bacterium]OGH14725.1 MAG: hypothetical protein A2687_02620 [Candidatus Levybacteria bacterium RIFCSPHIGHO2_01_FULL_38_26]
MKRPKVTVEKRKILGKSVKKLRREGILPANIYGKDIKSLAVQLPQKEFENVFKDVGETGLVDVAVNGETKPSLIHNVQYDYLRNPLHADFFQVNLKEEVKTMVPIEIAGEAKAVTDKVGLILQPLSELEVEALPEDLPEHIEVNVEKLAAVDDQIIVKDITPPKGVKILTDPDQVIVKIGELVSKEAQEQAAAEAQAAEEAKVEGTAAPEGAKTEAPGEAAKATTETKTEEKPSDAPKTAGGDVKPQK